MRLICDDYNDTWVWVEDLDENVELSPHFDYEEDAVQWRDQIENRIYEQLRDRWEKEREQDQ